MKYKRMYLFSLIITASSAFVLPQMGEGYGLPLNWIIYKGDKVVTSSIQLFQYEFFKNTQFNLAFLLLNSILIFLFLMILYKALNMINKD